MVVVGCVIENALFEIIARTIERMFVFVITEVAATVLLVDGVENVEELANTGELVVGRDGVEFCEGGFCEARLRRKIAGKANSAHTSTISREIIGRGEVVLWGFGREVLVVAKLEKLLIEGWVVG